MSKNLVREFPSQKALGLESSCKKKRLYHTLLLCAPSVLCLLFQHNSQWKEQRTGQYWSGSSLAQWLSLLAEHSKHLESFWKSQSSGHIPDQSNQNLQGWAPGAEIFKAPQVAPIRSKGKKPPCYDADFSREK